MTSRFASATSRCSALFVLVAAACDVGTRTEAGVASDAALTNAADAASRDTPEMQDVGAAIDYFATKPLCASEVASPPVGGDGTCSLQVPSPDASLLDFTKVNLILRVGGARVQLFEYVADIAACGAKPAWHYDDASNPQRLVLCPETCSLARSDPDTQIEVVLGCDSRCAEADNRCESR